MNQLKRPFFSVVIPVYNKEPHIHRSISSVLAQTFEDYEVILINDASTDNSLEEIKKFTDPRIHVFHRDQPGPGGYAARNLGIEEARGDWVAFLDADDEWYSEHLEKMHALSLKFPDVFFMSAGWEKRIKEVAFANKFFVENHQRGFVEITVSDYLRLCLQKKRPVNTDVACIKKSSEVAKGLFPSDLPVQRGGDLHAWLKMICRHRKMAWSPHIGAAYYQDSVNMVTKTSRSSPELMKKNVYNLLATKLNKQEKVLLKKLYNTSLKSAWIGNIHRGKKNFFLPSRLYWRGDFQNAFFYTLLTLIPAFVFKIKASLRIDKKQSQSYKPSF